MVTADADHDRVREVHRELTMPAARLAGGQATLRRLAVDPLGIRRQRPGSTCRSAAGPSVTGWRAGPAATTSPRPPRGGRGDGGRARSPCGPCPYGTGQRLLISCGLPSNVRPTAMECPTDGPRPCRPEVVARLALSTAWTRAPTNCLRSPDGYSLCWTADDGSRPTSSPSCSRSSTAARAASSEPTSCSYGISLITWSSCTGQWCAPVP